MNDTKHHTPRTDKHMEYREDFENCDPDFARQLKRELQSMTALADRLAEALGTCRFKDWFKTQETGQISVILNAGKVREALTDYEKHKKPEQQIKQPCDCIEKCGRYWIQRCDCQNGTSLAEVQSWCDYENKKGNTQ